MSASESEGHDAISFLSFIRANDPELEDIVVSISDAMNETRISDFCNAVPDNSNIQELHLMNTTVDQAKAAAISSALARMPFLESLTIDFSNCERFDAAATIVTPLAERDCFHDLDLNNCAIGDRQSQAIASSFSGNNSLQTLDLSDNHIGDAGAIAIASLIARNGSLTSVHLEGNDFGDEGARAIAQSIAQNRTLESMKVAWGFDFEDFGNDVEVAFKAALYNDASIEAVISSNHTLRFLEPKGDELSLLLHINRCGPEEAKRKKIVKFVNENPKSLLSMGLNGNSMPNLLCKIGQRCLLNAMFEVVRNAPDLFLNPRKRPYRQCRKRSRLS